MGLFSLRRRGAQDDPSEALKIVKGQAGIRPVALFQESHVSRAKRNGKADKSSLSVGTYLGRKVVNKWSRLSGGTAVAIRVQLDWK